MPGSKDKNRLAAIAAKSKEYNGRACRHCGHTLRETVSRDCLTCRRNATVKSEERLQEIKQRNIEYMRDRTAQLQEAKIARARDVEERRYQVPQRLENWREAMNGGKYNAEGDFIQFRPRANYGGDNSHPDVYPYNKSMRPPLRQGQFYGLAQDLTIW